MITYLRYWFKKPYGGEGKRQVESYVKSRVRAVFWMFILVVLLIVVVGLEAEFNISGILGIPCEYIYTDERCSIRRE